MRVEHLKRWLETARKSELGREGSNDDGREGGDDRERQDFGGTVRDGGG